MKELDSPHLHLREMSADTLAEVLPVYLSNPAYRELVEGSEGVAGRYDLERWQRDWSIAQLMPGRHSLACYLKANNEAIGYIDYLDENESDGLPWLGMLMIHADYQGHGLGTEALQCLIAHCREERGWSRLRASVLELNTAALAFFKRAGFKPVQQKSAQFSAGQQTFYIMELALKEGIL
ncbi:N-acetyltransferase [Ktedonosporobacter rubrisoli]|uniref:N-acetyltransferase n=1 Tax=Ktedonosporobacter rubrisoli TaxID=2509675 RepID=A0A4P6JIH0_KTERU|nr:GNAT family N-acetyltransferase [Ktedonosporobacter rubrisoli]QBD74867.1 N-acetyltransferase [Ktedonosporobacter rubrisoli]